MRLIPIEEAAKLFGMEKKKATLRMWVHRGDVAGCPGRPFFVDVEDLESYIMQKANLRLRRKFEEEARGVKGKVNL